MSIKHYIKRAITLPPHEIIKRAVEKISRRKKVVMARRNDFGRVTYALHAASMSNTSCSMQQLQKNRVGGLSNAKLHGYLKTLKKTLIKKPKRESKNEFEKARMFAVNKSEIIYLANLYANHYFDLLGSGCVQVKHGMVCSGLEGHKYETNAEAITSTEEDWLKDRINQSNLKESQRIWGNIDEKYTPIDWHLDFKSGFRWNENEWSKDIRYGNKPGVDIKVPWELSRMQHLPILAWAYSLLNEQVGSNGFEDGPEYENDPDHKNRELEHFKTEAYKEIYKNEFRNQVLDFIATNPPRYGVNWVCTMDVGIRIANMLIAYDMFTAFGASFDKSLNEIFTRSVYEHGEHIINNLEWSKELRSNHYLSDIVGLLFVAAYLPSSPDTNAWLAFSVRELINEVENQFLPDGGNFEASTSYHRLSAELVVYATALILGLPKDKLQALYDYDHTRINVEPGLKPAPIAFYSSVDEKGNDNKEQIPFPISYIERLYKIAEFTLNIVKPDGKIPQVGDNDSGRFLKIEPDVADLDHRHLVAAFSGILDSYDKLIESARRESDALKEIPDRYRLEVAVVGTLAKNKRLPFQTKTGAFNLSGITGKKDVPETDLSNSSSAASGTVDGTTSDAGSGLRRNLQLNAYPDFGLYVYRSDRLYMAVRCGQIGQLGNGGHGHNDQLSIELSIDGVSLIVDPGTYLYTPAPDKRNLFRSTAMHNTLVVKEKEQNKWLDGPGGLFWMFDQANPTVIKYDGFSFSGKHDGFSKTHKRTINIRNSDIAVMDECEADDIDGVYFHFAPDVKVAVVEKSRISISKEGVEIFLNCNEGEWLINDGFYSPAYGVSQTAKAAKLRASAKRIEWIIECVTGAERKADSQEMDLKAGGNA